MRNGEPVQTLLPLKLTFVGPLVTVMRKLLKRDTEPGIFERKYKTMLLVQVLPLLEMDGETLQKIRSQICNCCL